MPAGCGDEGLVQVQGCGSAPVRVPVRNRIVESQLMALFQNSLAVVERST